MSSLSTLEPGCKQTLKERMATVRLVCQKCNINGYQKKRSEVVEKEKKKSAAEGRVCRRKSACKKSNRGCSVIVKNCYMPRLRKTLMTDYKQQSQVV